MHSLAMRLDARLESLLTGPLMSKKKIVSIMLPLFLDQLAFVAINMVNTGMISSTGVAAVGAVGMVDTLNNLVCQLYLAVAMAATVLVARLSGANNPKLASRASVLSLSFALGVGLVIALVLGVFRVPILNAVYGNAEAGMLELAKVYLLGIALMSPFNAVINTGNGVLRGMGDASASLSVSIITNGSYALLNLLFLPVLHLGVHGLVYALLLSKLLGSFFVWMFLSRRHIFLRVNFKTVFKASKEIVKDLARFALPYTVENLFFCAGLLAVQMIVVGFGPEAVAANTIAASIFSLLCSAGDALCATTVTVVGQCMGQNGVQEAKRYLKVFLSFASIASGVILAVVVLSFPFLIKLFGAHTEIAGTVFYLILGAGFMNILFWPRSFMIPAGLRTAGDIKYASLVILISVWVVRVAMCYLLAVVLDLGVYGTWGGMCFEWAVRTAIFTLRLRSDKWYKSCKSAAA